MILTSNNGSPPLLFFFFSIDSTADTSTSQQLINKHEKEECGNYHTQAFLSISFDKHCSVYSRTSPNDHLSTTATYFVLVGSPYIDSRLNLVTTATSLQRQRQRPLKRVPNGQ